MTFQKILRNAKVSQAELHYENSEKKKRIFVSIRQAKIQGKEYTNVMHACAKVK